MGVQATTFVQYNLRFGPHDNSVCRGEGVWVYTHTPHAHAGITNKHNVANKTVQTSMYERRAEGGRRAESRERCTQGGGPEGRVRRAKGAGTSSRRANMVALRCFPSPGRKPDPQSGPSTVSGVTSKESLPRPCCLPVSKSLPPVVGSNPAFLGEQARRSHSSTAVLLKALIAEFRRVTGLLLLL
jgi:hypothetical protein